MRKLRLFSLFAWLLFVVVAQAQSRPNTKPSYRMPPTTPPSSPTSTPPKADAPVIMLLHMLNSNRAAWDPLIPDLLAAGYALLNIDMRGHGDSGGTRDWDKTINDVAVGWVGLAER